MVGSAAEHRKFAKTAFKNNATVCCQACDLRFKPSNPMLLIFSYTSLPMCCQRKMYLDMTGRGTVNCPPK